MKPNSEAHAIWIGAFNQDIHVQLKK
jgi:hypothetical protein